MILAMDGAFASVLAWRWMVLVLYESDQVIIIVLQVDLETVPINTITTIVMFS